MVEEVVVVVGGWKLALEYRWYARYGLQ